MKGFLHVLWPIALVVTLTACKEPPRPTPPASLAVGNAIGELYVRGGVTLEVVSKNVLGMHYRPGTDTWKVISCVEFRMPEGKSVSDCNDSFELYALNSGRWIVNGTINGQYLWLEMPRS